MHTENKKMGTDRQTTPEAVWLGMHRQKETIAKTGDSYKLTDPTRFISLSFPTGAARGEFGLSSVSLPVSPLNPSEYDMSESSFPVFNLLVPETGKHSVTHKYIQSVINM